MRMDTFFSLADSKNVALILSLVSNVALGFALTKVYMAKEKLHEQVTEFVKALLPFVMSRRNEKN